MITFDISDYTFEGAENYEVQDIYNWDFVEDIMYPEFKKIGYTQERFDDSIDDIFDNGKYEIIKRDYEIKRFYNQTISRKDFRVSGHIEWRFNMLNEEVVLFSDFDQDELYNNHEAHVLFDKLLVDLRDSAWPQFKEQFEEWAKDKTLVNDIGEKVTEDDIRIEYNNLSDDDLYEAYDQYVVSDEFEFEFDFDNIPLEYIEEEY